MAMLYEVTPTALNMRAMPDPAASIVTVLRRGQVCVATAEASAGWLPVVFNNLSGYVSARFLRAVSGSRSDGGTAPPSPVLPADTGTRSSVDPEQRQRDRAQLHPRFRAGLDQLLAQTTSEGIPFRVFEAFRSPERQDWLYGQGRSRPGGIVTRCKAWHSFHQFGLAADLVLFIDGQWTWSDAGPLKTHWTRLRELAHNVGLRTLDWEAPHVEWPVSIAEATAAPIVSSGDEEWLENLQTTCTRWRNGGGAGGPGLLVADRPPLEMPDDEPHA